jgi:hypothetical protein
MQRKILLLASLALVLLQMAAIQQRVSAAVTAGIFCNGDGGNNMGSPTDSPSGLTTSQINGFRASGMTTMILFQMSILANGDFVYDGQTICSGGSYVGTSNWGSLLNQCRVAPSGINRIEICLGGANDASWTDIKNLIAANGTSSSTVLYQNLSALRNALGIDAIDSDDELAYDSASAIQFGQMCAAVGLHLTLCPYTNKSYWHAVQSALGSSICDRVYLQCYQGGAGNDPANWASSLGVPVAQIIPGYWDNERDTTFLTNMLAWSKEGCTGGWLWPTCEQCDPPASPGEMLQYAGWMLDSFDPIVTPVTAADVVGSQVAFSGSFGGNNAYQWQVIKAGVTNNIPGATNVTLTLANLQLTNTASYQLLASNASGVFASGTSSLTVSSTPSPVNNVIASYAAQTGLGGFSLTPTWTIAPGSVIYGHAPSVTNGNFSEFADGQNVNSLTAGGSLTISQVNSFTNGATTSPNYVTCGNGTGPDGSNAGATIIYTLTNSSAGGYNLTNIMVYGGWKDAGRDQQAYTVYYSKVSAPATFILLGSINYNPVNLASAPSATRATLTPASGWLATNVAAVKFDFTSPASENGWCGYAQIQLFGTSLSPAVATNTLPVTAADVVGSQVTFTAAFTALNPMAYQWQKISGGVTNNVAGATNTTLTLTNLQLTNTASYQLMASNAFGVAVSNPGTLTVSSVPAAVNNVITELAAQTGPGPSDIPGTTFTPTWTVTTNNSLIAGQSPSTALGNFSVPKSPGASVNSLTAGGNGAITVLGVLGNTSCSTNYVTCGNGSGAGSLIIYTLTGATQGYNLTNLTVYAGWTDGGRDQQAYTVYYSTIAAPTSFIQLSSVNYLPPDPSSVFSATRVTLLPASGALATNVAAVKFDFTTPASENGYEGYSEIGLYGMPTVATNPPNIAVQFTASSLTLAWPADHTGWQLQEQTNGPAQGLGTNWWSVAGSTITNQMSFPVNPTDGSVFFRLLFQ